MRAEKLHPAQVLHDNDETVGKMRGRLFWKMGGNLLFENRKATKGHVQIGSPWGMVIEYAFFGLLNNGRVSAGLAARESMGGKRLGSLYSSRRTNNEQYRALSNPCVVSCLYLP